MITTWFVLGAKPPRHNFEDFHIYEMAEYTMNAWLKQANELCSARGLPSNTPITIELEQYEHRWPMCGIHTGSSQPTQTFVVRE